MRLIFWKWGKREAGRDSPDDRSGRKDAGMGRKSSDGGWFGRPFPHIVTSEVKIFKSLRNSVPIEVPTQSTAFPVMPLSPPGLNPPGSLVQPS